jgi:zinc transporter 1
MGFSLSRATRISIVLVLTSVFFVVELGVGYYANSLALIADSFHMLNDLLSMVIALYAIKLTARGKTLQYSYGLHRAEILAALTNGIFLLALCFSIILEALGRFYTQPDVKDPKLVVVVGCLGLLCNLVGLLLFHEHGHGHSHGHSHNHDHGHKHEHSHKHHDDEEEYSLLAEGEAKDGDAHDHSHSEQHESCSITTRSLCPPPLTTPSSSSSPSPPPLYNTLDTSDPEAGLTPLKPVVHSHCHGHNHGSMNMRALVLHVMGDALGNLGVIFTGLVMWLTKWSFRFYFDPAISLFIAVLICLSAVPLVRSAARILLQATPHHISPETARTTILAVPGVTSLHQLHMWQLSEAQCVASVHVELDTSARVYMDVAAEIKRRLAGLGIENVTIQPEFLDGARGVAKDVEAERVLRLRSAGSADAVVPIAASSSDETLCIHQEVR